METITRKQYKAAQKALQAAEAAAIKAMRAGNQTELDKATDDGAKALAITDTYHNQQR